MFVGNKTFVWVPEGWSRTSNFRKGSSKTNGWFKTGKGESSKTNGWSIKTGKGESSKANGWFETGKGEKQQEIHAQGGLSPPWWTNINSRVGWRSGSFVWLIHMNNFFKFYFVCFDKSCSNIIVTNKNITMKWWARNVFQLLFPR